MNAPSKSRRPPDPPRRPTWLTFLIYGALVLAALLALAAVSQMFDSSRAAGRLAAEGWGEEPAQTIVRSRIGALWHGAFMCGIGAALLFLSSAHRPGWTAIQAGLARWGLALLIAIDAVLLARHYVHTMPMTAVQVNEVVRLLKSGPPEQRVAMASQEGFYNNWLTYLFPYHGIKSVNITQMPRMPEEYQRFLQTVGRNPLRFWQLSAVGYLLAPAGVWNQIQADPAMKDAFSPALEYNVGLRDGDLVVVPATPYSPGQHVVLKFEKLAPYAALFAGWTVDADDAVLRRLADPAVEPFQVLAVAPESEDGLPASSGQGLIGSASVEEYASGRMTVKVSVDRPALLRLAEKYDPGWRARINGKDAAVRRVDYLFLGVLVGPGLHTVEVFYKTSSGSLYVLGLGVLVCAGAGVRLLVRRGSGSVQPEGKESDG